MDQADIKLVGAIEAHLEAKDARIAELEARIAALMRDLYGVAVCECGHLLEPCHQTPGMECSIAGCPCAHYREAHKPRTVTHIPDSSGLTLPQLVAGKQALYSCSEDPSFDDVRAVIAAVAQSNPTK